MDNFRSFNMKMPRGIFITYAYEVAGSLEVNMKTAFAVFMPLFVSLRESCTFSLGGETDA